jgi:hypothetical protein
MDMIDPTRPMASWLEQAWLDRYLERRLDDAERAAFEAYLLDKPHLLDRIAADLDLRDGLALAEAREAPRRSDVAATASRHAAVAVAHGARRRSWRVPAVAASLAVAFGAGFLIHASRTPYPDDGVVADPTRIVVDATRGGEAGQRVDNASGASRFVVDTTRGGEVVQRVDNASSASRFVLVDALVPADAEYVAVRGPGLAERRLSVSKDGVASLLLRRDEIERVGALTLVVRSAGHEFERPLHLPST